MTWVKFLVEKRVVRRTYAAGERANLIPAVAKQMIVSGAAVEDEPKSEDTRAKRSAEKAVAARKREPAK